jgi:hypothetical protein
MAILKEGIIQIIVPFTPVWVIFDDGKGGRLYEVVHLWALVEDVDKNVGVEGLAVVDGDLVLVEGRSDFIGYSDVVPFYGKRLPLV